MFIVLNNTMYITMGITMFLSPLSQIIADSQLIEQMNMITTMSDSDLHKITGLTMSLNWL